MIRVILVGAVLVGCFNAAPPPAAPTTNVAVSAHSSSRDYRATIGDPVGFLPGTSELVLAIDGEQIRKSPLWSIAEQRLRAMGTSGLSTFQTACGFDPVASIRGITLGIHSLKAATPSGVVVITGMSRANLTDCLERASKQPAGALRVTADEGFFTINDPADPTTLAVTFVDDATSVILVAPNADRAALEKVLASGSPLRRSSTFTALLAQVDTSSAIWGVANGSNSVFDLATGTKPSALWGSIQLDNNGAALALRLRFADAGTAAALAAQVQGQIGAVQAFFDRLDVVADAADLVIDAEMSESKLTSMISLLGIVAPQAPPVGP